MRRKAVRACWALIGLVLIGLGVLGIFVPGLPTTIFLIGASFCFYRGSDRLAAWLDRHPVLGRYLEMAKSGRMPLKAKIISLAMMWTAVGFSTWFFLNRVEPLWIPAVGTLAMAAVGSWCIVRHGRRAASRAPVRMPRGTLPLPVREAA
ncbi:MAG: YbaN family protein [Planctomycetota bacterium]